MSDLVVKTNRLNTATQNLSLTEVRIMQLAIVDARETGLGLTSDSPLTISASRYAEAFGVSRQSAYEAILKAEKTLFERRFSFLDDDDRMVKSRWVQRVKYLDDEASIEVILTYDVVNEVTRIDGYDQFFTQYLLEQTANMNSAYSVRLYELLVQWKKAKKTPVFDIEVFREQLGVELTEYNRIYDFKKNVVDLAMKEINDKTDLKVSYKQKKKGRKIVGFEFAVLPNKKTNEKEASVERNADNGDIFTVEGLSDKQLGRIARNPIFVADYNHLVSSTSPAGQDTKAWEFEMINRLKKDPKQFSKRSIKDYLDY